MELIVVFFVVWIAIMIVMIAKATSDLKKDEAAPVDPDYSKTGWEFHEDVKQRAKWNANTISEGNKQIGEYWLSGKDRYLIIEKKSKEGQLLGYDIPYDNIESYAPYKYEHGQNKNVLGRALVGEIIAGPIGGILGVVSGYGRTNLIDSLGVIVTTFDGERFDLKVIDGLYKTEKDDYHIKNYVQTIRKLDEIVNGSID